MQAFLEWSPELSVGIEEIDEQHKVLVGMVNKLYNETVIKQGGLAVTHSVLQELVHYTIIHFSVEESLFRVFDYPHYDNHKKQHEDLKRQVVAIYDQVSSGKETVNIELIMFLRKWLKTHIMKDDKTSSAFLLERGLKKTWAKRSWVGRVWDSIHQH